MQTLFLISIFAARNTYLSFLNIDVMEIETVEKMIITVRDSRVIIDRDVAALYGVETKRVNEAVKNNPEKFPDGYVFQLSRDESESLRSKISTLKIPERGQHSKYLPKAFTEKGLYMLATILKSPVATQTTLAIIETFTRFRDFTRTVSQIASESDEQQRKSLVARSGECLAELLDGELAVSDVETVVELNLAMLKFRHVVKRRK